MLRAPGTSHTVSSKSVATNDRRDQHVGTHRAIDFRVLWRSFPTDVVFPPALLPPTISKTPTPPQPSILQRSYSRAAELSKPVKHTVFNTEKLGCSRVLKWLPSICTQPSFGFSAYRRRMEPQRPNGSIEIVSDSTVGRIVHEGCSLCSHILCSIVPVLIV